MFFMFHVGTTKSNSCVMIQLLDLKVCCMAIRMKAAELLVLSCVIMLYTVVLTFESVDEILQKCDHSNVTFLSGAVCYSAQWGLIMWFNALLL